VLSAEASVVVRGVRKRYGPTVALDGMTFTVLPGHVTGFVGPNGAGKSTTMRVIVGLDAPDAGTALVGGRPYRSLRHPMSHLGALLDAAAIQPSRSGRNHLLWLARSQGLGARRVDEVAERVGLQSAIRRKAGGYSLGMRQRLGIAGALLADPPVLMFDEPANGLDPEGIRWMRGLLRGHAARGGTVLLSSHLLGEVEHTVDRLLVIGQGRIVADGPVAWLLGADGTVVRAVDAAALAAALEAAGFHVQHGEDGAVVVPGAAPVDVGAVAASAGLALVELRAERRGLEDLFFQLTEAS
jgi:ABC-2 type transport system ATP-binding protein